MNSFTVYRSFGHALKIPMLIGQPGRYLLAIDSFQALDNSLRDPTPQPDCRQL
jgi:hypothetical protein